LSKNNNLIESLITSTNSPTDYLTASENSASSVESVVSNKNTNTNACISVECDPSESNCMTNTNAKSKTQNVSACENDLSLPKLQSLTSVSLPLAAGQASNLEIYSEQSVVENKNSQSSLTSTTSTCSSNEEFALPPTSPPSSTSVKPQLGELVTDSASGMSLSASVEEKPSENSVKISEKPDEVVAEIKPKTINENESSSSFISKEEESRSIPNNTIAVTNSSQSQSPSTKICAETADKSPVKSQGEEDIDENEEDGKHVATSPDSRFFKFETEIGRGSFKTVYKGLDTETGVPVAWLELLAQKLSKAERARFRVEAELLKGLQHPNIVRFFDSWDITIKSKKCLVLVTELMTSGTLKTYLRRFKTIKPKVVGNWCRQILKGLNFLHTRKPIIIHRDLKCDNIFITGPTGSVKIGDLGLATLKKASCVAKSVIGTPEFMAPEIFEESYDEKVDIYAFGMCMIEMMTGEYPYSECVNPAQIYRKVTQGIQPNVLNKIKSKQERDLILMCLNKDKDKRSSAAQLLNDPMFTESSGIRVELASRKSQSDGSGDPDVGSESEMGGKKNMLVLQLNTDHCEKYKQKHNNDECLEFEFDMNNDNPTEVAKDMVQKEYLLEEDLSVVAKLISSCVNNEKRNRKKADQLKQEQHQKEQQKLLQQQQQYQQMQQQQAFQQQQYQQQQTFAQQGRSQQMAQQMVPPTHQTQQVSPAQQPTLQPYQQARVASQPSYQAAGQMPQQNIYHAAPQSEQSTSQHYQAQPVRQMSYQNQQQQASAQQFQGQSLNSQQQYQAMQQQQNSAQSFQVASQGQPNNQQNYQNALQAQQFQGQPQYTNAQQPSTSQYQQVVQKPVQFQQQPQQVAPSSMQQVQATTSQPQQYRQQENSQGHVQYQQQHQQQIPMQQQQQNSTLQQPISQQQIAQQQSQILQQQNISDQQASQVQQINQQPIPQQQQISQKPISQQMPQQTNSQQHQIASQQVQQPQKTQQQVNQPQQVQQTQGSQYQQQQHFPQQGMMQQQSVQNNQQAIPTNVVPTSMNYDTALVHPSQDDTNMQSTQPSVPSTTSTVKNLQNTVSFSRVQNPDIVDPVASNQPAPTLPNNAVVNNQEASNRDATVERAKKEHRDKRPKKPTKTRSRHQKFRVVFLYVDESNSVIHHSSSVTSSSNLKDEATSLNSIAIVETDESASVTTDIGPTSPTIKNSTETCSDDNQNVENKAADLAKSQSITSEGKKTGEQLDNVITANATSSTLPTLQNACIECQTEVDGKTDQKFSVQLDKDKAEDIASRLIEESKLLESNKDLFVEQLKTIITKVKQGNYEIKPTRVTITAYIWEDNKLMVHCKLSTFNRKIVKFKLTVDEDEIDDVVGQLIDGRHLRTLDMPTFKEQMRTVYETVRNSDEYKSGPPDEDNAEKKNLEKSESSVKNQNIHSNPQQQSTATVQTSQKSQSYQAPVQSQNEKENSGKQQQQNFVQHQVAPQNQHHTVDNSNQVQQNQQNFQSHQMTQNSQSSQFQNQQPNFHPQNSNYSHVNPRQFQQNAPSQQVTYLPTGQQQQTYLTQPAASQQPVSNVEEPRLNEIPSCVSETWSSSSTVTEARSNHGSPRQDALEVVKTDSSSIQSSSHYKSKENNLQTAPSVQNVSTNTQQNLQPQNSTHLRRSPSTSSLASISSVNSAASVQGQHNRHYPPQAGQNVANQQHSVASTQNRNRKVSQGSAISTQHELEIQHKIIENISVPSQKQIESLIQQSSVSQQSHPVSTASVPINLQKPVVDNQLYKIDTSNQDLDKQLKAIMSQNNKQSIKLPKMDSKEAISVETSMMETDNKYDHQTDIESIAGESVISLGNVPLTQETINTEDTLQRSASQVLVEQKQSQQQSGTEVQQTGRFQIIPVTNTSDLEQKNFSEPEKTAVKPVKQIGRFEISVASQSFDNTTTSLNQTLVTEQVSENSQQAPLKPEHHSTPTKSRKDPVLTRDGSAESVSSPLMLDHTVQDGSQLLNTTLNSVALSTTQISMPSQFVQAEQVINRPYVPIDVNNQSFSTSIVNQHQLAKPKNPHPLNSPTQSQYGDDDSDDPNEDDREYKELIKRQHAEMDNLLRKHQREFERLRMLKKKKRMKSKKELQNLIHVEGAGKVVVASGEVVNNPSQTSSNDSSERRLPQPSAYPLSSYSDTPVATQNPSTEVADASLYKADYNQDAYAAQVNTSKFSADKTLQNVSKQQNLVSVASSPIMVDPPVKDRPPVPPAAVTARRKRPDYLKLRRQHSVMSPQMISGGSHRPSHVEHTRFSQSLNISTRPMLFEDGPIQGVHL